MKQGSPFVKKQGTLMALACAAAFAAPQAMAQVASPDFGSGKGLTLSMDFLLALASKSASGATGAPGNGAASDVRRRTAVESSSSSVYIQGSEKLGGSFLQGWGFLITWDFDPDEYNRRGANEVATTVIGVQTPAGNFFMGVMDNPFKQIGSSFVAGTSTFGQGLSQSAVLGNPGFRSGTAKGSFDGDAESTPQQGNVTRTMSFYRLNANSVNWYSPDWNGFRAYAQWVPGDNQVPTGVVCPNAGGAGGTNTCDRDPRILGAAVTYNNGPFRAGYAYEHHRDSGWGGALGANSWGIGSTGAGVGTHDSSRGHVVGATYQLGNFRLGGFWQRLEYDQSGGTTLISDLSVDAWYVGARWRSGPHEASIQYARADDYDCAGVGNAAFTSCRNGRGSTGMKHYGIGYRYAVSKQLRMFASWGRMDNDEFAAYTGHAGPGNTGLGGTVQSNMAGQTITIMSVGINGSF